MAALEGPIPVERRNYGGFRGLQNALIIHNPIILLSQKENNLLSLPDDSVRRLLVGHHVELFDNLSVNDMRYDFVRHIVGGECFKSTGWSGPHCHHVQNNFVGKHTFLRTLFNHVIQEEARPVNKLLIDVCKSLNLVDELLGRNASMALMRVRDSNNAFFEIGSIVCDNDRMALPILRECCVLHGIDIRFKSSDVLRRALITHIFTKTCELRENSECVTGRDDPNTLSNHQVFLLQDILRKNIRKKPLQYFFGIANIHYDAKANVGDLRKVVQKIIATTQKNKKSAHERVRKGLFRQGILNDEAREIEWPSAISEEAKKQCFDKFCISTSTDGLRHYVCAVCGEWKERLAFHQDPIPVNAEQLSVLKGEYPKECLNPFRGIAHLDGLLLDKDGLIRYEGTSDLNSFTQMRCCNMCYAPLFLRDNPKMPDLALANDMILGDVPQVLQDLTVIEEAMIARRRSKSCILHLKELDDDTAVANGPKSKSTKAPDIQRGVKGHFIIFPSYPEQITSVLPATVDVLVRYICVLFVGSARTTQQWLKTRAKPLLVRRDKVRSALEWLQQNNPLYNDIVINHEYISSLEPEFVPEFRIDVQEDYDLDNFISSGYDPVQSIITQGGDTGQPNRDVYSSIVVADLDGKEVSSIKMASEALLHLRSGGKFVQIPHGAIPSNDYEDYNLFPLLYPTLYPYGCGGFNSPSRANTVSMRVHARHLFNMKDQRFQTHYSFPFAVFNVLQRHDISSKASIRVKNAGFNIFCEQLNAVPMDAINAIVQRSAGGANIIPSNEGEKTVLKLMSQISLISSNVDGTMSAKIRMRNEIRAMIMSKGLPSFYITINPSDSRNPIVKILDGELFDIDNMLPIEVSSCLVNFNTN